MEEKKKSFSPSLLDSPAGELDLINKRKISEKKKITNITFTGAFRGRGRPEEMVKPECFVLGLMKSG